ncbi:hypothetical protein [Microbacterium arborescens]
MAVTITATLLAAANPQPVQVALSGVPAGESFEVFATTSDGSRWDVPGGRGVSTGGQVLLIDNRTALNAPIAYQVVVGGVTYRTAPVTAVWDGPGVIQTVDGLVVVGIEIASLTEARTFPRRSGVFEIAGREDPAVRLDVAGSASYKWEFDTEAAGSAVMRQILRSGMPIVRRLTPGMRDFEAVVIGIVTSWGDELISDGFDTWRRWSLTVREIADPQPATPLIAFTWDDFDAAMADRTWSGTGDTFDGLFATWDDFDATDWSLL